MGKDKDKKGKKDKKKRKKAKKEKKGESPTHITPEAPPPATSTGDTIAPPVTD
jgi:hypothetical protein